MDLRNTLITKFNTFKRFVTFVIAHFIQDGCTYRASALTFTTLLAIVPLMTVGFAIFSSFPAFQKFSVPVQNFIFENFVPATGQVVQNYLQQFVTQVSNLSIIGVGFLFVTALLVMLTIERAMNKIWRVHNDREGVAAFLLYWAILSLAPVFLGLSLAASSYIISVPLIKDHQTPSILLKALPFLLSLTGFTFLYVVVPNRPVKFIHGLAGGFFATVLIESAKAGFVFYLSRYNTYELLYGAFATLPIFFIWIYWVWFIALLGAEVSYALSVHHERRQGKPVDGFSHALSWLYQLWLQQRAGKGLSLTELIERVNHPFMIDPDNMIDKLQHLNLIHCDNEGNYLLSRDLHEISLYWLSQNLPYPLPTVKEPVLDNEHLINEKIFIDSHHLLQQMLSISLAELFASRKEA